MTRGLNLSWVTRNGKSKPVGRLWLAGGATAGGLPGSLWLALSRPPFIKQGQTSQIIDQMGQCVLLNTWYKAIRHLITGSLGCSWLGVPQAECTCDGLEPGTQVQAVCVPLIGFSVLHWTMEQVETGRGWKNYRVLQRLKPAILSTPLEYQSKKRQLNLRHTQFRLGSQNEIWREIGEPLFPTVKHTVSFLCAIYFPCFLFPIHIVLKWC